MEPISRLSYNWLLFVLKYFVKRKLSGITGLQVSEHAFVRYWYNVQYKLKE